MAFSCTWRFFSHDISAKIGIYSDWFALFTVIEGLGKPTGWLLYSNPKNIMKISIFYHQIVVLDLTFPCLCGDGGLLIYITTLKNGESLRLALAKILSAMGPDSVYKNESGFKSFGWRLSNMSVTYGNISWVLSQGVPDFWNHDLIKVLQHVACFRKSW